jgi:hypothetical protein
MTIPRRLPSRIIQPVVLSSIFFSSAGCNIVSFSMFNIYIGFFVSELYLGPELYLHAGV